MAKSRREEPAEAAHRKMRAAEESSRKATSRREKVKAAIQKIRAFHELGRSLLPRQGHQDAYGKGIIDAEAKRLRCNPDTVRKARQFADRIGGYTRVELNDLRRLIREVQPGQDERLAIFEKTYVIRLLSVRRKEQRAALQEECIRKGWSLGELKREIDTRYGTRRQGGRKRAVPHDPGALLTQLEGMCEEWRRWRQRLKEEGIAVPGGLGKSVENVCAEVRSLQEAVLAALQRLLPGRQARDLSEADGDDGQSKESAGRRRREG